MTGPIVRFDTTSGPRHVPLWRYLNAAGRESAAVEAHAWIKRLRSLSVDGEPLRRRFSFRGDSLWWFTELYLHKQQIILQIFLTIAALERLIESERPRSIDFEPTDRVAQILGPQIAAAQRTQCTTTPAPARILTSRLAAMDVRARWLFMSSMAARARSWRVARSSCQPIAAFVHRAFWRAGVEDGSAESYIGPVLEALEARLDRDAIQYISLGPEQNFRARRWWSPMRVRHRSAVATPIEAYAPASRLSESRGVWRDRYANRRALWSSADLRDASIMRGYDCWPLVREELAGVALLQWPWSARAMDEAAAALDELQPRAALTYAEAGGWGRALMLECRRRGVPSIGLQHGFIYRQWLNYSHEQDEMFADPQHQADLGFPRPALTLVFDKYAAHHLVTAGRFPEDSIEMTGSPRLDALVATAKTLAPEAIERARAEAGASPADDLVLVATKHRDARDVLPSLVTATAAMRNVHVAIKTHPAETPDVYRAQTAACPHVTVLDASTPLAPLLRASRVIVTVNSTVALDAAVLGVPALVIGLPNNLSPFVDARVMAGADDEDIGPMLGRMLYDREFLQQLGRSREAFLTRFGIGSDGRAAERASDAILRAARRAATLPTS